MKLIDCPGIGARPINEFVYHGEVRQPPPQRADGGALAAHVFHRAGAPGVLREWWFHTPTGRWFVLERDTRSDTVLRSLPSSEIVHALPTR